MQQTGLTLFDGQARILQIENATNDAHALANKMQDITTQMTTGPWLGNQATRFSQKMQQYTDDFNAIVTRLTHIADTGKANMNQLVNHDSE
jgi:hypothetical protein